MNALEIIKGRKRHLKRLATQRGAAGERWLSETMETWIPRPKGARLKNLLRVLEDAGILIKGSSFDAISCPVHVDFDDISSIEATLPSMVFVEIKTASQLRVKDNFRGYFFALTEGEIAASDALKDKYIVALYNTITGEIALTTVPEIISKAKSTTWQLSVQL